MNSKHIRPNIEYALATTYLRYSICKDPMLMIFGRLSSYTIVIEGFRNTQKIDFLELKNMPNFFQSSFRFGCSKINEDICRDVKSVTRSLIMGFFGFPKDKTIYDYMINFEIIITLKHEGLVSTRKYKCIEIKIWKCFEIFRNLYKCLQTFRYVLEMLGNFCKFVKIVWTFFGNENKSNTICSSGQLFARTSCISIGDVSSNFFMVFNYVFSATAFRNKWYKTFFECTGVPQIHPNIYELL